MAGKVGKSGRRSNAYENSIRDINDREIGPILTKAAKYVNKFFDDPNVPIEAKAELGRGFLVKAMPQNVELKSTEEKYHEIRVTLNGLTTDELRSLIEAGRNRALPATAA